MKYLLSVIFFLCMGSTHADVYKWVDEKGVVHYGDKPTSGSKQVDVKQHKTPDLPETSNEDILSRDEKRQRITDMLEEDRLESKKRKEEKKIQRERKRRECNRLKDRQRHVERATGLYRLDKDGNRVFISNEQRKKSEQALRKRIQKVCG